MPEKSRATTATVAFIAVISVAVACSSNNSESSSTSQPTTEQPTTSTDAPDTTTTTTAPRPPLAERAFPPLDGLEYASLPPDELTLFAGALDANPDSDVVTAVDARAVGNPGDPVGVLVAYELGPAFANSEGWLAFVAGIAEGAGGDLSSIDVDGTDATLVVDDRADTVGILWRADDDLALLALGSDGSEAFSVASARVAVG